MILDIPPRRGKVLKYFTMRKPRSSEGFWFSRLFEKQQNITNNAEQYKNVLINQALTMFEKKIQMFEVKQN